MKWDTNTETDDIDNRLSVRFTKQVNLGAMLGIVVSIVSGLGGMAGTIWYVSDQHRADHDSLMNLVQNIARVKEASDREIQELNTRIEREDSHWEAEAQQIEAEIRQTNDRFYELLRQRRGELTTVPLPEVRSDKR